MDMELNMRFCRHDGRGRKTRLLRFWTLSHAVRLGTPFLPPFDNLNLAHRFPSPLRVTFPRVSRGSQSNRKFNHVTFCFRSLDIE